MPSRLSPIDTREARVLEAVRLLGQPTTLDVAARCGLPTRDARRYLRGLEAQGQIRSEGRRWVVPSLRLQDEEQPSCGTREPRSVGCLVTCLVLLALGLGCWGLQ